MSIIHDKMRAKQEELIEAESELKKMEYVAKLQEKLKYLEEQLTVLRGKEFVLKKAAEDPKEDEMGKLKILNEASTVSIQIRKLEKEKAEIENILEGTNYDAKSKKFNKYLAFANIRELLKNSNVKIGHIEKEAGCQPGYMSRLEKPGSASEPSVEFLVTAARLLNVSLDMLVSLDLSTLSATEKYILSFIEKLQKDTVAGKLEWNKETATELNNIEPEPEGYVPHPLFDFYMHPEEKNPKILGSRICMYSDTFEAETSIHNDCYNLTLKNGARLYLMDICKNVHVSGNVNFYAKEIWMYKPHEGSSCLITNKNQEYGDYVQILFEVVSAYMSRPRIKKGFKSVIDAFMADDFEDDLDAPFN